ncbi:MAG: porphobilinogen deaminase [Micavibrio sp.]|nr:MAG: porphobilinogen deaminase [Micavibrio sp.]
MDVVYKLTMTNSKKIKIGSRGSPLALKQVEMVKAALGPEVETETVIIKTSGDWNPADGEVALPDHEGGKALFAKEIEEALLADEIDVAVHSMKDMDSTLPEGLIIPCMLPREDPRDALITRTGATLDDLPEDAVVGTTSPRRKAFLLARKRSLKIVPFRGNVGTRLEKLKSADVDATVLAVAGLKRLGLAGEITQILDKKDMIPAAGQGAIGLELKAKNEQLIAKFSQINCLNTNICVNAERSFIQEIGGSCHTPVGAHAILENNKVFLQVMLASEDGNKFWSDEICGEASTSEEAIQLGKKLGESLKSRLPEGVI